MDRCGLKTARSVESALGTGRNAAARYVAAAKAGDDIDLPRYVRLAMSAHALGLKPWDEHEGEPHV